MVDQLNESNKYYKAVIKSLHLQLEEKIDYNNQLLTTVNNLQLESNRQLVSKDACFDQFEEKIQQLEDELAGVRSVEEDAATEKKRLVSTITQLIGDCFELAGAEEEISTERDKAAPSGGQREKKRKQGLVIMGKI